MKSSTHLLTLVATLGALSLQKHSFSAEIDSSFAAQVSGTVHALSVDAAGKILVGGEFSQVNGSLRENLALLEADGSLDSNFTLSADGPVLAISGDGQGSTYIGGAFNSPGRHLARLLANGQPSPLSIGSSTSSRIDCLAVSAGGEVAFGGPFRQLNGASALYVGKVTSAGGIESNFSSGLLANFSLEAGADALALQADGKVILGGNVNTANGFAYLVRLQPDGSIDTTFSGDHGPILYTKAITVLPNGQIMVAGMANSSGEGFVRRLNSDGSIDASFEADMFNGSVEAIAIDADGGILVGGSFSGGLAHLNADGSTDPNWNISTDGTVKSIAIESDESVVVGGVFTTIGGRHQASIARIILGPKQQSFIATNANGRFYACIQGEPGKTYEVQASTDLKSWADLGTTVATEVGIEIADTAITGRKLRFFRARLIN